MDESDDLTPAYNIGRGKPPIRTQFQKGKSGNPRGRPKGSKNFATHLATELGRRVTVNENGRRRKMTKSQAAATQLVNKAVSGDIKAFPLLLNETRSYEAEVERNAPASPIADPDDLQVLESMIRRIRESDVPAGQTEAADAKPTDRSSTDVRSDQHDAVAK